MIKKVTLGDFYEQLPNTSDPRWEGWKSLENGIQVGTIRMIDEKLFYCWTVHEVGGLARFFGAKNECLWGRINLYRDIASINRYNHEHMSSIREVLGTKKS